jgi:hypothetical protein
LTTALSCEKDSRNGAPSTTANARINGSRKNKFAILGVEAPGRQGAKTQEYLDIPSFRNTDGRDASAFKM